MWKTTTTFWLALLVVLLVGAAGYRTTSEVEDTGAWIEQTNEIIEALGTERLTLAEASAPPLPGDRAGSHETAARALEVARSLRQQMADQVDQAPQLEAVEALLQKGFASSGSSLTHEPFTGADAGLSQLIDHEKQRLAQHQRSTATSLAYLRAFIASATLLSCAILLLTFSRLRREVASRVESERRVRENEETLAITLMSISDGVIATDTQSRIVRMNRMAEQLTGWSAAAAVGAPVSRVVCIFDEQTREPIPDPIDAALRSGAPIELREHGLLLRRDASELPIANSCAPVRDLAGNLRGAVLVFRDVSEAYRNKKLRETVQRQMIFADRMAAVGTLAAGVAHEINNPLCYISGNLELLMEELRSVEPPAADRSKELEDMALQALAGTERIRKIVRGLKTFSRADEDRRTILDARPVLELAINMAMNEVRHRARLVTELHSMPLVEADEARLGQVFVNLIVNAAQAIREGDVAANEIRVTTSTDLAGNAVVEVSDTGEGIPAAHVERIFDPFFTTKPIGVGTGLGLSICHSIIGALGGQIGVKSEPGRGTTFRVTLPASTGSAPTSVLATTRLRPVARATVLVVDDETAVGRVLARVLSEHHVSVVNDARDALSMIARGMHFDVILSDLMMPEMSGMDFFAELTRLDSEAGDRVIFMTGGAFSLAAQAFLDRVPNARLTKPFEVAQVRSAVQDLILANARLADSRSAPQEGTLERSMQS